MAVRRKRRIQRLLPLLALAVCCVAAAADPNKVLHIALPDIETLDPDQAFDDPSSQVISAVFEGLYEWDYLAAAPTLVPVTAAGPPEVSADGLTWTVGLKPGIYFTDDPAFKGKPRELIAQDFVYSFMRAIDPNLGRRNPVWTDLVVGARAAVDAALESGKFDYDRPIEGITALDRYTLRLKFTRVNYPLSQLFLLNEPLAREVVEAAKGDIRERPVGTGPYRLREWKRGSRIVLEANSKYRTLEFPSSSDPALLPLVRSMQGKKLPQIGVIEISVIEEDRTLLLEFERGALDVIALRSDIVNRMLSDNKLKTEYAAHGIERYAYAAPSLYSIVFNMDDAVVGGMARERIALRRAIALGFDRKTLIEVVYSGQALPANQLVPPGVSGHDPAVPLSPYDPRAANALLDRTGYKARDAGGYRMTPDGKPVTLTISLRSGALSREIATLLKKNLDALGLRSDFRFTPFQDWIKDLEGGKFQMYWGGIGGLPSGHLELVQLDGRRPPPMNSARFRLPEYDRAVDRFYASPDEAGRIKAAREANDIAATYMPLVPAVFPLANDFVQPWVQGYHKPLYAPYWKYLDIDLTRRR